MIGSGCACLSLLLLQVELEVDVVFEFVQEDSGRTWIRRIFEDGACGRPLFRERLHLRTLECALQAHHIQRRASCRRLVSRLLHVHVANADAFIDRTWFEQIDREIQNRLLCRCGKTSDSRSGKDPSPFSHEANIRPGYRCGIPGPGPLVDQFRKQARQMRDRRCCLFSLREQSNREEALSRFALMSVSRLCSTPPTSASFRVC